MLSSVLAENFMGINTWLNFGSIQSEDIYIISFTIIFTREYKIILFYQSISIHYSMNEIDSKSKSISIIIDVSLIFTQIVWVNGIYCQIENFHTSRRDLKIGTKILYARIYVYFMMKFEISINFSLLLKGT